MRIKVLFKLVTILMGILSTVIMLKTGFRFALNEYLEFVAQIYNDAIEDIALFLLQPMAVAALHKLSEWFAIDLHLEPHWQHTVTLLWLYFGSSMRGHIDMWDRRPIPTVFEGLWATLCAVVGGVAAGTFSPSHPGFLLFPVAAYFSYELGVAMLHRVYGTRHATVYQVVKSILVRLSPAPILGTAIGYLLFAQNSPALVSLCFMAGITSITICWEQLYYSLLRPNDPNDGNPERSLAERFRFLLFSDREFEIGIDVLFGAILLIHFGQAIPS